ncbi:hypothetical protein LTR86_007755 [Recurvomyces mirabilis]|nr:hypothetical protein LTR86_007755 [Recurvomyces mirabilis]
MSRTAGGEHGAVLPLPRLDMLPEELVSNIVHRLDYDDLASIRLVCRALETKSFHDFATEYFSAKAFMISSDSLNVLTAISEDKRLRTYLRSIYIITCYYSDSAFKCPNGCHCAWKPSTRQAETYRYYIKDQAHLKASDEDQQILTRAFRNLPNLAGLHIADGLHAGEDMEDARLYGLQKVLRRTNRPPSVAPPTKDDGEYGRWFAHVWLIMLRAIAQSGTSTITDFGSIITKTSDGLSVGKNLKISQKTFTGMMSAMQNVKSLHLTIRGTQLVKPVKGGPPDLGASAEVMSKFASIFDQSKLEEVVLSYDMSEPTGRLHTAFMQNIDLSKLKKLSMDGVQMPASALIAGINQLISVNDLLISWTSLSRGNWTSVLRAIAQLPTLDHLHLMWLQEDGRKCYFLEQQEADRENDWLDDGEAGFDADDEEDDDDDDESMPELEPADGFDLPRSNDPPPTTSATPGKTDQNREFQAPGREGHGERGYYVCLKGAEEIAKYIPIFIKEYNLGEDLADEALGMPFPPFAAGGAGPPGMPPININNLMNMLGAPGLGGAPHVHPPAPAAFTQGNNAAGGGPHAHNHGPHVPQGFASLGHGPGYSMMVGTLPMHGGPPAAAGAGAQQANPPLPAGPFPTAATLPHDQIPHPDSQEWDDLFGLEVDDDDFNDDMFDYAQEGTVDDGFEEGGEDVWSETLPTRHAHRASTAESMEGGAPLPASYASEDGLD